MWAYRVYHSMNGFSTEVDHGKPKRLPSPTGPPVGGKEVLTAEDVASERMITLDREFSSNLMVMNSFAHKGHIPFVSVRTEAVGFSAAFAAHGSGITVVNDFIARQCDVFNLKAIPFYPGVVHEYVVFWRRGSDKVSKQASLVEAITDLAVTPS
ncbi:LysR family transcriptional regulator substrate-binding protein (plasmid) [Agrobacterium leguminum]|uniref:LysR substrate-binding domain-containing protein n=1 Tax=Agrobacterium deltaense NCPPB 1641 TaxID=1183425 RepID=A0A1S7U9U9_9HYPH|nr:MULTISPECIES: LysR family transcriptional regulator substrate-binding protein [Agrobacterium]WFS69637.1 LysR family transcriptional regulator substrate-binding protein [Agrobacterium leguminum]CVI63647.1 hypothetical protein AGR7A_pAt20315 [Agrobacterium deltaense NCPPB 1641]